jgi:hypothetical protein
MARMPLELRPGYLLLGYAGWPASEFCVRI